MNKSIAQLSLGESFSRMGGSGKSAVSIAQLEYLTAMLKSNRKINSSADPKMFKRYELMRAECVRRRVRFLPAQVLRPLYLAAGL